MSKIRLSIIIPVYNEANTILRLIDKVQRVRISSVEKEIIIVDDYSTDGTRKLLKKLNEGNIQVLYQSKNIGKGAALRVGFEKVTGDIVIVQDADLEYDPNDYEKLIRPIVYKQARVVYGSRFKDSSMKLKEKLSVPLHYFGNVLLSLVTSMLYSTKLSDIETGYKVIDTKLLKSLNLVCNRFEFDPEITAKLLKKGENIIEVPIYYNPRKFKEGKKITWKDGLIALWWIVKLRIK